MIFVLPVLETEYHIFYQLTSSYTFLLAEIACKMSLQTSIPGAMINATTK